MDLAAPAGDRTALIVYCGKCAHIWTAMYLPLDLAAAGKLLKHLHCPMCAAAADEIKMKEWT